MKPFMDKDFLLDSPTARHLYHDFAAAMPIIDYHCHLIPREIYGLAGGRPLQVAAHALLRRGREIYHRRRDG